MRTLKMLGAGLVALSVTQSVWAQAGGGGAGAGGAGQAAGQAAPGQAGAGQAGGVGTGMTYGGINQTPWFANQGVRTQLNLNEQTYGTLNNAYKQAWTQYQTGLNGLSNLPESQRSQQLQQLQSQFNNSMNSAVSSSITDPQQRSRYNQLYMQYQGFGAFNDPTIQQKLNLTDQQRRQISQYANEWNQQMGTLNQNFQRDPSGTAERYNQLIRSRSERINSVLTPQQQQMWQQMTGSSYNFPADTYFNSGGATGGTTGTTGGTTGGQSK